MHGYRSTTFLSSKFYRKKLIITNLAANVGKVISVELNPKGDFGGYVHVRFWLDMRKELTHFVTINPEGLPTVVM
jgi:hypothetical protein